MDGMDIQRCVTWARAGRPTRMALASVWRRQDTPPGSAADCLKQGRDPSRRLEALRRRHGTPVFTPAQAKG